MIEKAVETWLQFITGERLEALDALLADGVVFSSPNHLHPTARPGWAHPAPHTARGERHGGLHHWSTAVGTSGDGLVRGISPEDGCPDRKTRRHGVDRGQHPAGPDSPGRGGFAAPLPRRRGVPVAPARPSPSQPPAPRAAA